MLDDEAQRRKELEEAMRNTNPRIVEKYGNPLDENDPRNWEPSTRGERGISVSDRVRLLELDMEVLQLTSGKFLQWMMEQQKKELLEQFREDPEGMISRITEAMENLPRARGASGDQGPAFAGSSEGLRPDDEVETPEGIIRVDQIPGYRDDPEWRPSPDWIDGNCMCSVHVAQRAASTRDDRFNLPGDNGPGTGLYL